MRAAQPSIIRSAQAGHGRTANVHRESKGENVGQNYDWMRGQPFNTPTAPQSASKPTSKPTQQKPQQKPTQKPPEQPKPQAQPQNSGSVASGKADNAVNGQDLAGKFQFKQNGDYAIEQVIKAQGFDGKPTLTSDAKAFSDACKASNFIAKRGVGASDQKTLNAYDQELKTGDFYVKCSGGSVHGYGMYAASVAANGRSASLGIKHAESTAKSYADWGNNAQKIYTMTLDKSAKIGNENSLARKMQSDTEFQKVCQNSGMRSSYTMDVGVYAAYKGYDAYIAGGGRYKNTGASSDYTVILNRSKVILYDPAV